MPVELLTQEQEARYGRFTAEPTAAQLSRYFHFDSNDLAVICQRRGQCNWMGFALQLSAVRFLGTFVSKMGDIPAGAKADVASQLGIRDIGCLRNYQEQTRWLHTDEIRQRYGYRDFNSQPEHWRLVRWLYTRAWAYHERPSVLFDLTTARLIDNKILLPGVSVMARLVSAVRDRTARRLWARLAALPDAACRARLERLLTVSINNRMTDFDRLRRPPVNPRVSGLVEALDRLEEVQALGVDVRWLEKVPRSRLQALTRHATGSRAQTLARMPEERRVATLVAFAVELSVTALDDVMTLLDEGMGALLRRVEGATKRERMRTLKDLDAAALILREACATLLGTTGTSCTSDDVFAVVPRIKLQAAADRVGELAQASDEQFMERLLTRYSHVRQFLPALLKRVRFAGGEAAEPVLAALEFLRAHEGRRAIRSGNAPGAVVSASWKPLVCATPGRFDKRAYTFCVLDKLRRGLRRHDIYVPGSRRWADPRAQLLTGAAWDSARAQACRALNLCDDGAKQVETMAHQLNDAYRRTTDRLPNNTAVSVTRQDGEDVISLSPLERQEELASLSVLRKRVADCMPQVDLPDLLLEVATWTGFTREFSHVSESQSRATGMNVSICAVLLAEACNIGLEPLAQANVPALAHDRLAWVAQNYVRSETITRANARLVDYHASLPLAQAWGGGDVASADGMRFTVPVRTVHAGYNGRYFGNERGVTFYNYVSDQFSGFHAQVVPGTLRDSLFILNGLLEQQTSLRPTEIMSDTAGYSDIVFGLFHLRGYQFSPRLADVTSARLWRFDADADYGPLQSMSRQRINADLIQSHWDDLLRVAASLKQGLVSASDLIATLQARPRPTTLGRAIGEVGRFAKSLYMLAYIDNEAYRRRILVQLNRGENRHFLARAVFYGKRGALYQKYREGQEDQLGTLGLLVNMIALWNTRYMSRALAHLEVAGVPMPPEDIARLSPLGHGHINFLGRYQFDLAEDVARGEMRPLATPNARRWSA